MTTVFAQRDRRDSPLYDTMDLDAAILEQVGKRHADLINGIKVLYATLIEMRYLRDDEMIYPPYGVDGKPAVAISQLQAAGFVPEAIALMELLPYPSNEALERWSCQEEGVAMAPDSGVMSYLEGHDWDATIQTSRQPHRAGDTGIPAWAFKITFCGANWGTEYLYDTRDRRMRRWDSKSENPEYEHQPNRATTQSWDLLRNELRSLDWVPWRDESGHYPTLNIHTRPSLLSSVGATNRYQGGDDEKETQEQERQKLKQDIERATMTIPALRAAVLSRRKRSGSIGLQELKHMAVEYGVTVSGKSPCVQSQPEGWAIGWVLDHIERDAPDNHALRKKILSMRRASAQEMRNAAIEYGCSVPEVPEPPAPPPAQSDPKVEVTKAIQNMFSCKRQLFLDCGWGNDFRGDEFETRRKEFEDEYQSFFAMLGPRAQNIHDPEEGAWLREWFRQKAGERAV